MIDDKRPLPEFLLSRIKDEEDKVHRGKLKIFFGSSAGVGKTYSMLSASREAAKQGLDVLVGYVETHGRPNTENLLEGLRLLPPLQISYHGIQIKEFDLDAALTRKPDILVLDELAHTNTTGARHPKRWNDVLELLDAGISVYTTLNVQHLESLSDLIAGTTGVWVKETVPDSIFDLADDIVLVDIDTDDLLKRLHEGNVYIAPGANKRAAENFFKKDNLNALREIALRRTAQRVDAERDSQSLLDGKLPISDKILVCISQEAFSLKLIRAAKRLASALKSPWVAVYVEKSSASSSKSEGDNRVIELLERMVTRLNGKMVTLEGDSVIDEILSYARKNGITKIIAGKSRSISLKNFFKGFFISTLIRRSGAIDILVITDSGPQEDIGISHSSLSEIKPFNYLIAFVAVACFTIPGLVMPNILTGTDQALLYLTGIVMVAESMGLGPSLFYALLAASAFSIFFSTQHLLQETDHRAYFMTFIVMLVTGYAIATQSSRLKIQAITARERESRTRALYEITKKLTSTRGRFPVAEVVSTFLSQTHDVDVTVWMTNSEGHPAMILGNLPDDTYYKDFGALQWCFENAKNAGRGTTTMPSAAGFYLPLTTSTGTLGVMGAFPKSSDRLFTFEETSSMETLSGLLASALERVRAGEIAAQAIVEHENKKLRESLSSAIPSDSTDSLSVFSSSLGKAITDTGTLAPAIIQSVTESIHRHSKNARKAARQGINTHALESRSVEMNRQPVSIAEHIHHAIIGFTEKNPRGTTVTSTIIKELPDVLADVGLLDQMLRSMIEAAVFHAPSGSSLSLGAERHESNMILSISFPTPPFFHSLEPSSFDQLHSPEYLERSGADNLDLAIAAGIARLHGGRMWVESMSAGQSQLCLALPIA